MDNRYNLFSIKGLLKTSFSLINKRITIWIILCIHHILLTSFYISLLQILPFYSLFILLILDFLILINPFYLLLNQLPLIPSFATSRLEQFIQSFATTGVPSGREQFFMFRYLIYLIYLIHLIRSEYWFVALPEVVTSIQYHNLISFATFINITNTINNY